MSHRIGRLDGLRRRGMTLLLVEVDLKAFKERDLTPEKLDEVRRAFAAVRQNGLKAIVRFAYGFTGRDYRSDPKDMDRILGHIRQLGKVFLENRDVLYGVQAGFLGPWGEWHGSNWGDPPSLQARRSVLFALLDAVPGPVTVHVRRPMFIRDIFAGDPGGAEITEATAYGGSRLSRVGWHDDALLSLPTDMGTYAQRGWDRERELRWCAEHGRFTPFGGRRSLHRLARRSHRSSANWNCSTRRTSTAATTGERSRVGGKRRIGAARPTNISNAGSDTASWRTACASTKVVTAGGTLRVELDLHNAGFASPHMPRDVALVLSQGDRTHRVALTDVDPRRWTPEAGTISLRGAMPIPADARGGRWRLALQLADPSPSLSGDGRYAIRLANEGITFDEAHGGNVLAEDVEIRER